MMDNFSWVIPDKLAGSALPGGRLDAPKERVLSDLTFLFDQGVRVLVSLQKMPLDFGGHCAAAGLSWIHFPIEDFEAPASMEIFAELVDRIIAHMNSNQPVCVHCRAGVGRTGLVLTCIVGRIFDVGADIALATVRKSRSALDTNDQRDFVNAFLKRYII